MGIVKLRRFDGNPILRADPANDWEAQNVSNAGAVIHNGKVHILYRAEGYELRDPPKGEWPHTRLGLAISQDGYHIDQRFTTPALDHEPHGGFGEHGIQDPRISKIDDTYWIVSALVSRYGDRVHLSSTKDFKTFRKHGLIMPEYEQRTCGLFPAKVDRRYALLHRWLPNMWLSYSTDLKTWTDSRCIWQTRFGTWYDLKLGLGAPPIRQDDAWLLFWHARGTDGMYRLGVMWLDLADPSKVLRVQDEPILECETDYERDGFFPNVVYTCGAVELNGEYLVYYGCADRCLAVASVPVDQCCL